MEIVSVRATSAIPKAPAANGRRSPTGTVGKLGAGKPCGRVPTTLTPLSTREKAIVAAIPTRTAISTPGTRGMNRLNSKMMTRQVMPMAAAAGTMLPPKIPRTT